MKILADESVDNEIVLRLREDGHEVSYVAEMSPGNLGEEVLLLASEDLTLLVTADKDFGEDISTRLCETWNSFISLGRAEINGKSRNYFASDSRTRR